MKKIAYCLIAAVSACSGISNAWAAGCSIKEAPDPALQEYLKGVDKLVVDVLQATSQKTCQDSASGNRTATSDVDKAQSSVMGSVNKALKTDNVVTSFRFTVDLIKRTELPAGIRRDASQLDRRQRSLISAIDSVSANCGSETVLPKDLSPFPPYSTAGKEAGDVLSEALTNHVKVMELYREAVLGDEPVTVEGLVLVPKDFTAKIKEAYGPKALAACNTTGEGTFFEKVKQAIDRIGNLGNVMQNGTQDWKDAWALLQGSHKNQDRIEKQLLRKELSNQGLSTSASERALRNLDAYNRGDGWQGMNGSLQGIGEAVNNGVAMVRGLYDEAKSVGAQYAPSNAGQPNPEGAKSTDEYLERYKNLVEFKTDVGNEIAAEYEQARSLISSENVSVDENVGQLLEMHVILSRTINTMRPYCETSRQACLQQAKNVAANCGTCN